MPLLMIDLDDTLIDRTAALARWATALAAEHGRPAVDVEWIVAADNAGTCDRQVLTDLIADRFELDHRARTDVGGALVQGFADQVEAYPGVTDALDKARADGWTAVVVTNGEEFQQQAKVDHTGLGDHVDAVVISGVVGVKKPDATIFHLVAKRFATTLDGAWMVGDSPTADIRGAHHAGIRSVWLHGGRTWPIAGFTPTLTADSCVDAIHQVLNLSAQGRPPDLLPPWSKGASGVIFPG